MKYFGAIPQNDKPFMMWVLVAKDGQEYIDLGLQHDPLVIAEDLIPPYVYGVCPWEIVNGQLVERSEAQMIVFEKQFNDEAALYGQEDKLPAINKAVFSFDSLQFPMNEVARLHYSCIERTAANYKVLSTTGVYDLEQADHLAFINAYYAKLLLLTT